MHWDEIELNHIDLICTGHMGTEQVFKNRMD